MSSAWVGPIGIITLSFYGKIEVLDLPITSSLVKVLAFLRGRERRDAVRPAIRWSVSSSYGLKTTDQGTPGGRTHDDGSRVSSRHRTA